MMQNETDGFSFLKIDFMLFYMSIYNRISFNILFKI